MIKSPIRFINNPVVILNWKNFSYLFYFIYFCFDTISVIFIRPDDKMIALFGVATGRQKARLTLSVNGKSKYTGCIFASFAYL